jgi:hypothetical protein
MMNICGEPFAALRYPRRFERRPMRFNKQRYVGQPQLSGGPPCPKCGSRETWLFPDTTEPPPNVYACDFCGHAWRVAADENVRTTERRHSTRRRFWVH